MTPPEPLPQENWWRHVPTERQRLFLDLDVEEAFYGGAAGGGKSDALLMAALQYVHVPGYAAILFRRSYTDLTLPEALMTRAHEWLRGMGAKWNDKEKTWTFPSTATITFGYLEAENDKYRYQGSAYQFIGFDELTQFTETQYTYLFSRLRRLSGVEVPLRMRSASNPGGVGANWVFERFIPDDFTPGMAEQPRAFEKLGEDESGRATSRTFVPARLKDNPHLDTESYEKSLDNLDAVTREQLLVGDWHIKERGDILSMWNEPHHVITWSQFNQVLGSRHIPTTWLLGIYQDWGTTTDHPCVTSWFATAPENAPTVKGVKMAGSVFLYRGLMTWDCTVREVALELIEKMRPLGEISRVRQWKMSHEASSERIAYNREHKLPFHAWKTGRTRGIAQLRNALELVETDKPLPFNSKLNGHPLLYHIVDDSELVNPKTDEGLARWRAEAPAYHWATLKSGEPSTALVPYALFNDAMDTLRSAAADYWPNVLPETKREKQEKSLRPEIQLPAILSEPNPELQQAKIQSRDLQFKRMQAEEEREAQRLRKMSHPKVRFTR